MTDPEKPVLRVVRGNPDDTELAALTAAVVALAAAGEADAAGREPRGPSRWSDRGAMMRVPLRPGPGAWRASAH